MQDRYKDPNDFYAYPTLFFRETKSPKIKPTRNKKLKRYRSANTLSLENPEKNNGNKYDIDASTIKQYLPYI